MKGPAVVTNLHVDSLMGRWLAYGVDTSDKLMVRALFLATVRSNGGLTYDTVDLDFLSVICGNASTRRLLRRLTTLFAE